MPFVSYESSALPLSYPGGGDGNKPAAPAEIQPKLLRAFPVHPSPRCAQEHGRQDSQQKSKPGADLVELLAYSGCRIAEAAALTWADADSEKNTLTVTGGYGGTKNYESRIVPMTHALRALLLRLQQERSPKPSDTISQIDSAKKSLGNACRRLS